MTKRKRKGGSARQKKQSTETAQIWSIEKLVDCRLKPDGSYEFLIQWKNWDGDNTWEPEVNLIGKAKSEAERLRSIYLQQQQQQRRAKEGKLEERGEKGLRVSRKSTSDTKGGVVVAGVRNPLRSSVRVRKVAITIDDSGDDEEGASGSEEENPEQKIFPASNGVKSDTPSTGIDEEVKLTEKTIPENNGPKHAVEARVRGAAQHKHGFSDVPPPVSRGDTKSTSIDRPANLADKTLSESDVAIGYMPEVQTNV